MMSERGAYKQFSGRRPRRRDDVLYDVGRPVAEGLAEWEERKRRLTADGAEARRFSEEQTNKQTKEK